MWDNKQLCDIVIDSLPVALFVVDAEYKIVEFNPAAEQITGKIRSRMLGRNCAEVFSSSLCKYHCPLRESEKTGKPCLGRKAVIRIKGGEELPIFFSSRAILDDSGRLTCGIEIFRDATEVLQLDAHKRNIISLFTHDLKAPVSITGGFVDRLLQGKVGSLNEKQISYLQIIRKEINRLEQYISSFLDIARIESGQIELQREPCDVGKLLKEIVTGFEIQAADKQIELQMKLSPLSGPVVVDRLQIGRVISNLLDNAIKYSQENSIVRLLMEEKQVHLVLEIRDQGPGISSRDQAHIFDHFYRIDDQRRAAQGTGLGLAAVKAIVEAHSGRVWLRSKPGKGSSFFVPLPLPRDRKSCKAANGDA